MTTAIKSISREVAIALLLYLLAMIYQGYTYGAGDQTQILPCLWAQDHPGSYSQDHYVQAYLSGPVNERTIFHFLFRYLGYSQPWIVFIWHVVLSVLLFIGWFRIAAFFIKDKAIQWISLGLLITLGYHTSTGSNELYYPSVIPSLAAKMLGTWALYCWLIVRYERSVVFLIAATLLQPLVGLQLFLLTTLSSVADALARKKWRQWQWRPLAIYIILIAPWLYLLMRHNGGKEDVNHFFELIHFRLSHHFFATAFSIIDIGIAFIFACVTISFFKEKLRWFFITIVLGCLVYELGVEWKHEALILYTQWWKTTIWMEAFACIAIGVYIEKIIRHYHLLYKIRWVIPVLLLLTVGYYRWSSADHGGVSYMWPWSKEISPEVDIAMQAEKHTDAGAVFIVPIDMSAFRWYSKRNLYFDYKAMLHQESFMNEWYDRMNEVYLYGIEEKKNGFSLKNFSRFLLAEPSPLSVDQWKRMGITHFISPNPGLPSFEKLAENRKYAIYALPR